MISVGIDIGTFSVKVAEVRSEGKLYDIIRFDEYPLSQDPSKDNEIDILEILRDVANRYPPGQTKFVFAVHQDQVSLRRLFFPFKERHKILKSLPFELDEEIPFSMDDAIFDARISRYLGNTADIIAVACPKTIIEDVIQRAKDGQIHPDLVSVDGLAFANLFERWQEAPPEEEPQDEDDEATPKESRAEVVINLGHSSSLVSVYRDHVLLAARTINWGGKNIAQSIAQKYSIHYVEALKELRSKAFILMNNDGATRDQIAMSDLVKASVDGFAHELSLSLLDLKSEFNLNFTHAALVGGVSLIRNLGPYITQTIEIPTNRLAHLDRHPELNFSTNERNIMTSLTAIGLALEGIKKPKNPPVNLLREEFALQGQSIKVFFDKWGHTLAVAAAMFVLFFTWAVMRDSFTSDMASKASSQLRAQGKTFANETRTGNIKRFIKKAERREKNHKLLKEVYGFNSSLDLLQKITAVALPKKQAVMNVRQFRVSNQFVQIVGEMRKSQNIAAFKKKLQGIALGEVKEIPTSVPPTKGFRVFAYQFKMARKTGG